MMKRSTASIATPPRSFSPHPRASEELPRQLPPSMIQPSPTSEGMDRGRIVPTLCELSPSVEITAAGEARSILYIER
jgi:hypothetical protein